VDLLVLSRPGMSPQEAKLCIALFTDGFTDLMGDCTSVKAPIQFGAGSFGAASAIAMKVRKLRAKQDLSGLHPW